MTEPSAGLASRRPDSRQRGSALVLALLVTVILALLGISFLLLAETENRIAQNEKRATQTLYVAEAGLVAIKHWFDATDSAIALPDSAAVDRTLRTTIDETDPRNPVAVTAADGVVGSRPYYKQAIDLDVDGNDDLFCKPYRGEDRHRFLGTPDGPDLRIDDGDSAGRAFLDAMSDRLFEGFPGESGDVVARITRIDLFAPPYERVGSGWRRYGLATARVTARLYREPDGVRELLAEQQIEGVLSEIPYRGPHAPLHSCGSTTFVPRTGDAMTVRWGPISSVGTVEMTNPPDQTPIPRSLPRSLPFRPGADQLFPTDSGAFDLFESGQVADNLIEDPWFRVLAGGSILGAPSGTQPWAPANPPGQYQDRSNLMQNLGLVSCPQYDYELWKNIASSGGRNLRYFAYDPSSGSDARFMENGIGASLSFEEITHGQEGIYFFDTANGQPPIDADADGIFDNLTERVKFGGPWDFTGFIFVNARRFEVETVSGPLRSIQAPGEPFLDANSNGQYDPGERFINLDYSSTDGLTAPVAAYGLESGAVRNARGPVIPNVPLSFRGILYTTGEFESVGSGTFYGSVIALERVSQSPKDGTAITPTIIWDESIVTEWPPPGWNLPRVMITEWDSGG